MIETLRGFDAESKRHETARLWSPFILLFFVAHTGLPLRDDAREFSSENHTASGNRDISLVILKQWEGWKQKEYGSFILICHTHSLTLEPSTVQQTNWKISRDSSDFCLLWGFFFICTGGQTKEETNSAADHKSLLMDTQDNRHSWTWKPPRSLCVRVRQDFN